MLTEPKLTNTSPDFGKPAAKQNPLLQILGTPHVDSFNYMIDQGLKDALETLISVHLTLANGDKVELRIDDISVNHPTVPSGTIGVRNHKIYPTECRQRAATYKGMVTAKIGWFVNGRKQETLERSLGEIPIMVKSNRCHLKNLSPTELIKLKEHEQEWGGYFIVKGHERLIRMLLMTRRNYPIAIRRSGWKQRGDQFSDLGILLRSVRNDNTAATNSLHYITNGSAKMMFSYHKILYYVPLILVLKCLVDKPDKYIYDALTAGCDNDSYYQSSVLNMMRLLHEKDLRSHEQCKTYIRKMFRIKFYELPTNATDIEVCDFIIKALHSHSSR